MIAAGIIFKTSDELDFVSELAGWISPPTEAAPAPAAEEPAIAAGDQVDAGHDPDDAAAREMDAGRDLI